MVFRLIFIFLAGLFSISGFFFHLRNEQSVAVDYVFGSGNFKIAWIVVVSMLGGVIATLTSLLPFFIKQISIRRRLKKELKSHPVDDRQ